MMAEVTSSNDSNVCTDEKMTEDDTNNSLVAITDVEKDIPKHPYHLQLAEFQPNAWQLEERQPQKYLPLEETKLTLVDSQELLDEMMTKLKQVKEFAIDLEIHFYHSFIGFVCLIEISTRTEDFVIDTIKLKEEITVLNEVCTNPNILKVFHGRSHAGIMKLQRDFGIFIVNMFDIFEAARKVTRKLFSSVNILKEICDVDMDKHHKFTDWRVRPLPSDMINIARKDTHYLLYIYDIYSNKCLHGKNGKDTTGVLLKTLYEKCTKLCGFVYTPPEYKADSYKSCYQKIKGTLTSQQLECFRLLHAWRDKIAREHDESKVYTLPNEMMFDISKALPRNVEEFTACCRELPPLVKQDITYVLTLVKKAIDYIPDASEIAAKNATVKSILPEKKAPNASAIVVKSVKVKSILPEKKAKKKAFCFVCKKPGHLVKDCRHNRAATAVGPYGNPHGGFRRGGFVGGYRNPHGVFHKGADGYGSRGFQQSPYSSYGGIHPHCDYFPGYEPIPQPYFQEHRAVRPRFSYYLNPYHQ